jgi:hypothetical protein
MTILQRLTVLAVGVLSLSGALASGAGAVTWHNSGGTTYSATAGPVTLSSTGLALGCTSSTATGTAPASLVGAVYASGGTAIFSGCSLAGQSFGVDCAYTQTAAAQDGTGMGSRVTGSIDITCGIYLANTKLCHLEGSASGGTGYLNNSPGVLNGPTTTLRLTSAGTGSCPLGNNDNGDVTPQVYTVESANSPTLTRTA